MDKKEEYWTKQVNVAKIPPIEPVMTPPNAGYTKHITEYTDDDEICDQLEIGRKANKSCATKGKWHEGLKLW